MDWANPGGYYYNDINNSKRKENNMEPDKLQLAEAEVHAAVTRALELWGTDFDDKNTANDWVAYVTYYISSGAYAGRTEKYSPEQYRKNLAKAAGLCIAAMFAIDRNGDCAPRHYEGLPRSGAKKIEE